MIQPTNSFQENLKLLPSIATLARIEILNVHGQVVASIENQPGKQGSLTIYQYLYQRFGGLSVQAAEQGLAWFAEHTRDALIRPGAHPNIDRLLAIVAGAEPLQLRLVSDSVSNGV